MEKRDEEYFDHMWLMQPWGENSILYTAEFAALGGDLKPYQAILAIGAHWEPDLDRFWFDDDEGWSYDNMTAIYCLSFKFGLNVHRRLYWNNAHAMAHPRDFCFYLWLAQPVLGLPFLWVTSLCMIWCALFTTYKDIDGEKVIATDGDLLSFLRLRSTHMPITQLICDFIMKKKWGGWERFFRIYFKDPFHPNRRLSTNL